MIEGFWTTNVLGRARRILATEATERTRARTIHGARNSISRSSAPSEADSSRDRRCRPQVSQSNRLPSCADAPPADPFLPGDRGSGGTGRAGAPGEKTAARGRILDLPSPAAPGTPCHRDPAPDSTTPQIPQASRHLRQYRSSHFQSSPPPIRLPPHLRARPAGSLHRRGFGAWKDRVIRRYLSKGAARPDTAVDACLGA